MANRLIRNTAILLKAEATYGTDPVPVPASNALLVSNLSINPIAADNVDRSLIRPYLGASEQLVGTRHVELGFDIELVGSGTVATVPAYGDALLACGFAGASTASTRYDFTPVSTGFSSATVYWYDDGVLHIATGCRGTVSFALKLGEVPKMSFKFTGRYSTPSAAANPSVTLTAFRVPQVVTEANTADITLAGTHSTSTAPAIVGGVVYPSQGLEVDVGNQVVYNALLGGETADIVSRSVSGKVTVDLTAAQEVTNMQTVESATLQSLGLIHGTTANNRVMIWLPSVQLINPQKVESNGKRLISFDLRSLPTSGNDDIRVVTSF